MKGFPFMEDSMDYKKLLDRERLPKHIGIIMDGNGRWAKKRGLPRTFGHREGMKRVVDIVEAVAKLNIEVLTLYAFSTQNWKRPEEEISALMQLLLVYINNQLSVLVKNNVKLKVLGDYTEFPEKVVKEIDRALAATSSNDGLTLNIALNYGGQEEIVRATKSIILEGIHPDEVTTDVFEEYLYTAGQPDLDLVMRPSGELRMSNFLLYQLAYAEFYFTDVLWPDFKEEELYKGLYFYQQRDRRFGGL